MADDLHLVKANHLGIACAKVVLLVDDALPRLREDSNLAEGDFTVATVEVGHDAFVVLDIACHDWKDGLKVDVLECIEDYSVEGRQRIVLPACEVDELRVHPVSLEDVCGVECTLGFADCAEQLPGLWQEAAVVEVAERPQVRQVVEAFADAVDAAVDKIIGGGLVEPDADE